MDVKGYDAPASASTFTSAPALANMVRSMSKVSKATKRKNTRRERYERRFLPGTTASPQLVYALGGLGAVGLGGGFWGQFGNAFRKTPLAIAPWEYAPWLLAGGAVVLGLSIWVGTSAAPAVRVGSGGVADEEGAGRRIAWWRVASIKLEDGVLRVRGEDEGGVEVAIAMPLRGLSSAAAWVVSEASRRVPDVVDLSDADRGAIGSADDDAGEGVPVTPLQLVGKRCSASTKLVAYEPDARVCPLCERVYHATRVPSACVCGASLEHLAPAASEQGA
jgi:hypothetical protein